MTRINLNTINGGGDMQIIFKFLIGYIAKRGTSEFISWLLDHSLKEFAKRTDNKLDDEIVDKFTNSYIK